MSDRYPGRPSLGTKARKVIITVRMSEEDVALIDEAADATEVTRSTFITDKSVAAAKKALNKARRG